MSSASCPSTIALNAVRFTLAMAAFAICGSAASQYKWIAPDGSVHYGDRPPISEVQPTRVGTSGAGRAADLANLPFELRNATQKYPVSLFVTSDCKPCDDARAQLNQRGIPFSERSVRTAADAKALASEGITETTFPILTVGKQKQVGHEAGAWDSLLNAAGYPKKSVLPPGYRPAPSQAMARTEGNAVSEGHPAAAGKAAQPDPAEARAALRRERNAANAAKVTTRTSPSSPSDSNPTGLRF